MTVMIRQRQLVYEYDDDDDEVEEEEDEQVQLSWYTAWLRAQRTKFDSRQRYEQCFFETTSRPALGPHSTFYLLVSGGSFPRSKTAGK